MNLSEGKSVDCKIEILKLTNFVSFSIGRAFSVLPKKKIHIYNSSNLSISHQLARRGEVVVVRAVPVPPHNHLVLMEQSHSQVSSSNLSTFIWTLCAANHVCEGVN